MPPAFGSVEQPHEPVSRKGSSKRDLAGILLGAKITEEADETYLRIEMSLIRSSTTRRNSTTSRLASGTLSSVRRVLSH
jgi:hypothetical protein